MRIDVGTSTVERFVSFVNQPVRSGDGTVRGIAVHGVDVTEHVLARREIEEREAYYSSLLAHSHDLTSVTALDGTIVYMSASVAGLLGWTNADLADGNVFDLIHPDDSEAVREQTACALAEPGRVVQMHMRLRHRDGAWRDFETLAHGRATAGGPEIVGNSRDVTSRKAAERNAQASDARFRSVTANVPDGFMLYSSVRDGSGCIVDFDLEYTNGAPGILTGPNRGHVPGRRLRAELRGSGADLFAELVQVVETGVPLHRQFTQDNPSKRTYRVQVVKLDDGFAATLTDVTDAHAAQQDLGEREARFRALVELIPQLVWSTTPEGYHDYFNQRWYDYTGMTPTGDQGWNWKDYLAKAGGPGWSARCRTSRLETNSKTSCAKRTNLTPSASLPAV